MPGEKFDAFISYSRSASAQLASELQVGIERFAKQWYRLRASRVFRDDSSMSANTALWGTIEGALRESGWLILLATPEAAASEYVNSEIAWWVEHKEASTILLVHAGGEISWNRREGKFSAETNAVPPVLRQAYSEEPRWVDLRWFSEPGSLGKSDARFPERVADLAAAVRNQERDSLVGENVRQRRRALTLLRVGITALSGLLVVSLIATGAAVAQGNEAAKQRDAAQLQARIASARQLAATSQSLLASDAPTAKLLAVYGYQLHADAQTEAALLSAVSPTSGDTTVTIDVGQQVTAVSGPSDGTFAFLGTASGRILRWVPGKQNAIELGKLPGSISALSVSDDGTVVAASAQSSDASNKVTTPAGLWVDGKAITLPDSAEAPIQVSPSGNTVGFTEPLPQGYVSKDFYGDSGFSFVRRAQGFQKPAPESIFSPSVAQFVLPDDISVSAWVDGTLQNGEVQHRKLDNFSVITDAHTPGGIPRNHPGLLAPLGNYIVQFSNNSFTGANPTELPIYDASSESSTPALFGYAPTAQVEALAVSSDLNRFATASSGTIYISKPRSIREPYTDPVILGGSSSISALDFLNADTLLSASGSGATIRRLGAGNPLQTDVPFVGAETSMAQNGLPLRLTLNETGTRLATLEQGTVPYSLENADGSSNWRTVGKSNPTKLDAVPLAWKSLSEAYVIDGKGLSLYKVTTGEKTRMAKAAPVVAGDVSGPETAPSADSARYVSKENRLYIASAKGVFELDGTTGAVMKSWPKLKHAGLSNDARFAVTSTSTSPGVYTSTLVELSTGTAKKLPGTGVAPANYRGPYLAQMPSSQSVTLRSADGSTAVGTFAESFSGPLVVSSNGGIAARFTDDGSISVVSVLTAQVLDRFNIHGDSREHVGVVFSGDGTVLVAARTANPRGSYSIINFNPKKWMRILCRSAGRDFSAPEWLRYSSTTKPAGLGCSALK